MDRDTAYENIWSYSETTNNFFFSFVQQRIQNALIKFLAASWEDHENANIIQDLQIYATSGN